MHEYKKISGQFTSLLAYSLKNECAKWIKSNREKVCKCSSWGLSVRVSFFFFQAEDGIRDTSVTGVQTCALPIYSAGNPAIAYWDYTRGALRVAQWMGTRWMITTLSERVTATSVCFDAGGVAHVRSEERRVGKECASGWWWGGYEECMAGAVSGAR